MVLLVAKSGVKCLLSFAWVYDRKYARSAARLLAEPADVLAAAGNVFARKKQEPRIDDEDKPTDEDAGCSRIQKIWCP